MMKPNTKYILLASVLSLLTVAGCQRESLENGRYGDGILNFSVGFAGSGEITLAKAATLTSEDGSVSIPLSCSVTDGIDLNLSGTAVTPESISMTKGAQYNSEEEIQAQLKSFMVQAWNSDGTLFIEADTPVTFSEDENKWQTDKNYRWIDSDNKTFLAYANLPTSGATVENSVDPVKQTFTYTVPTDAREQNDIMLGCYEGDGGETATADITIVHPLTAVVFKKGNMDAVEAIKSISIEGVYGSGTVDVTWPSGSAAYDWEAGTGADTRTGAQTVTLGPAGEATELEVNETTKVIGEPFIVLPQTVAEGALKLTMRVVKKEGGTEVDLKAFIPAGAGKWEEGKTNVYTLGQNCLFEFLPQEEQRHASDPDGKIEVKSSKYAICTPSNSDKQIFDIYFNSENIDGTPKSPWIIHSVQVGDGELEIVDDLDYNEDKVLELHAHPIDHQYPQLNVDVPQRGDAFSIDMASHDYWVNSTVRSDNLDWSPADWTSQGTIDLSKYDFSKDTPLDAINAHPMTTANCYIIRHAGTYKLPLVYGNAVKDGEVNSDAYAPTMSAGGKADYFLSPFLNHLGNGITSAFIENNTGCGGSDLKCAVVWQDMADVVKNLQITPETPSVSEGSYTKDDVRYLVFDVPQSSICQNNALICIYKDANDNSQYDSGEAVVWSWHIWTTNDPALLTSAIPVYNVYNHGGKEYDFFPLNCLGWIEPYIKPELPDITIVLKQDNSEEKVTLIVRRPAIPNRGYGCQYQFGRKDPMPATSNSVTGFSTYEGLTTLSGSILNPGVYYYGKMNSTWLDGTQYYNLWTGKKSNYGTFDQEADMIKTVYDPSPVGYKMPASKAFTGFTTTGGNAYKIPDNYNVDKGRIFAQDVGYYFYTNNPAEPASSIYFPVGHHRNANDGKFVGGSGSGNYWSAVPSNKDGVKAYSLLFDKDQVNPIRSAASCSSGLLVRPVLE